MPETTVTSVADRAKGLRQSTHPRLDGTEILRPDDIMEGAGEFIRFDDYGDPVGFRLGRIEQPIGRNFYAGTDLNKLYRQTSSPVALERSFQFSQELRRTGSLPPSQAEAARVPRPLKPIAKVVAAERAGYPASTEERPYWYAITLIRGGRHTLLSPPTVCPPNDNGQCFRVPLPEKVDDGVDGIGIFLTEPASSTANVPSLARMRMQRAVDVRLYKGKTYDLTGPYRYTGRVAPTANETILPQGAAPTYDFIEDAYASKPGDFRFAVAFTYGDAEGVGSAYVGPLTIVASSYYTDDQGRPEAGYGYFRVWRPAAPPDATGWYAYVLNEGNWYRVWDQQYDLGRTRPFTLDWHHTWCMGWTGSENRYAKEDWNVLVQHELPQTDATGVKPPDTAPGEPEVFGASYPDPGTYYLCDTEVYEGDRESIPSEIVKVTVGAGQMMQLVPVHETNRLANANYVELDASGAPLHRTFVGPLSNVWVQDGKLYMRAGPALSSAGSAQSSAQATAAMEEQPDWQDIDPSQEWAFGATLAVEAPPEGTLAGQVQAVLQQKDASGNITETVLASASDIGEQDYYQPVSPGSSASGAMQAAGFAGEGFASAAAVANLSWLGTTIAARVVHRLAPLNNLVANIVAAVYAGVARAYTYQARSSTSIYPAGGASLAGAKPPAPARAPGRPGTPTRTSAPPPPHNTNPPKTIPLPPRGGNTIAPPPKPPDPPATYPVPEPMRPRSPGTVIEKLDFESGMPGAGSGWRQTVNGTATMRVDPAAAISPGSTQGLLCKDTGTTVLSNAALGKEFAPGQGLPYRHDSGVAALFRLPSLPNQGSLRLPSILRPADGRLVAWAALESASEVASLRIDEGPKLPGSVRVNLNGTATYIAAAVAKEVAQLDITTGPSQFSTVAVVLGGVQYNIPVGGQREVVSLAIQKPRYTGYVSITVGDQWGRGSVRKDIRVYQADTAEQAAARIRATAFPGWQVSGSGKQVLFTAVYPGPKANASYDRSTSGTPGTITTVVEGATESAGELAARILGMRFPGWTVRQGANATQLIFTAASVGPKDDASFLPGQSGAVATMATTTQGALDTPEQLAARIRAGAFAGWATSGTGREVIFTATSGGYRQDATFDPGQTGVKGAIRTTRQGTNADLVAYIQDADGNVAYRRLFSGIPANTPFQLDVAVSGAGTDRAVISFWGAMNSSGQGQRQLLWRSEYVNLKGVPVGLPDIGVHEQDAPTGWEVHIDDVTVTDRGLTYHRDHNAFGELLNQIHGHYVPSQPTRDDYLLQDGRFAVLPGAQYCLAAYLFARGIRAPMRPVTVTAHFINGSTKVLGDVTDEALNRTGLSGTRGWQGYQFRFVAPEDCYEVRVSSLDVGAGEIIVQEVALSPGPVPLRTGRYAGTGFYRAILRVGPRKKHPTVRLARERRALESDVSTSGAPGATATVLYRSTPSDTGAQPPSPWSADPSRVPEGEIIEVNHDLSGDTLSTPEIRPGAPRAEYVMVVGFKEMATFLREDRTELPGGAVFAELEEPTAPPRTGVTEANGHLYYQSQGPPVGQVLPSVLQVFTPEAKTHLEEHWDEPPVLECWGTAYTVKLAGPPDVRRTAGTEQYTLDGERYAHYTAKLSIAEITASKDLAHRPGAVV